ncbi:MAG: PIN domain-containing protein [Bifidobacteriaceae bacterium]|jgi:PIN domain nuclease of toxin-antitoxin system|nr:PIN domain-containing protein [Bifidobacteriaceae bacterium]
MTEPRTGVCLDASVVVALVTQEHGWQAIRRLVARPDVRCVLPGSVMTEVIHVSHRKGNRASGEEIRRALTALGVDIEPAAPSDLVRAAELIEMSDAFPGSADPLIGVRSTLSLGDALALAVTERLGYPALTRDVYWKWLADQGHLNVKVVIV